MNKDQLYTDLINIAFGNYYKESALLEVLTYSLTLRQSLAVKMFMNGVTDEAFHILQDIAVKIKSGEILKQVDL